MAKVLSAGVIPIRRTPGGWHILVLRAYKNWDFPKGLVEPGEDPIDTAKREAIEETGLTDLEFPFGGAYRPGSAKCPSEVGSGQSERPCARIQLAKVRNVAKLALDAAP